ncbi:MAG: NAD(P)-binding domain-containing protein [Solirubrobacterales bacterium]|nr:NAD(P)-binding domain-containing protein [Solirubrobacterales bacterium]
MKIGIVGAGHIGGNCAGQAVKRGHEVMLSFAREDAKLEQLAAGLGPAASAGGVREAVEFGEILILSVPWGAIPEALEQAGDLTGKIVVDTTNQFGSGRKPEPGQTGAAFNAGRMPGARYTKSFNTLTAGFQAEVATRTGDEKVVQWICGDDPKATEQVAQLIQDMGYVPIDIGGTQACGVMEAPRRPGAVYGEEYRVADAQAVVDAVRAGKPIPPTPVYQ